MDMVQKNQGDESLKLLSHVYLKIFKINLTRDTYEAFKDTSSGGKEEGVSDKLSVMLKRYAETGEVHPDDREKYLFFTEIAHLREVFTNGSQYACCHYRRKVGADFRWVSMELVPAQEYTRENQVVHMFIKDIHDEFVSDIEEKDFVTGGLNRRGFLRQGRKFLEMAENPQDYAVLLFNIKGFKAINELFGIEGGDQLLRITYQRLNQSFFQPVLMARIEGDRFVCLVDRKNLDYDGLSEICKSNFTREEKSISVYIRCGIYLVESKDIPLNTMCDYAKIAKQCIVDEYIKPYAVFDQSMRFDYIVQAEVRGRIGKALENKEFQVYFQPICDARTGEIVSAEALVRWNHPERGLVSPGVFIPALEESGHVTRLDFFVLEEVKRFQKERKKAGLFLVPISVNLSWMDFYDEKMIQSIMYDLQDAAMEGIQARFEVTETSYAALLEREDNVINAMREAGAQILLDDFGSGYSSFSTVTDYDFDLIKLDMGFVQKIGLGGKVKSIIHSIIDMAHHMNVKVIAEGVETGEQLDFLSRHGCDYIQGYYFSKPLPEEEFVYILEHGISSKKVFSDKKELTLTDLISVEMLQNIQDAFSDMTGMAALTTDKNGVPVTKGSNFTEFCMKYTRSTELGAKRCFECDKRGAEIALETGNSCAYECHAGLVDFAAPIMANGEMFGSFIGGQVLCEKPEREKVIKIAEDLGIDAKLYQKAIKKVNIIKKERIDNAASFLYTIANVLSDIAYNKYMLNVGNDLLRQKNMELDFLANYDKLTKLSNRHHMQQYFQQFQKSGKPYCMIIGDIDDFKLVNDTYGHSCGDLVLSTVADIIKKTVDCRGVPGRWGGEEFLILLYGEKKTAAGILESVRQKIEENVVHYQEQDIRVTMTFGLAFCQEHDNVEKLITLADNRLYYGKRHGKNTIVTES